MSRTLLIIDPAIVAAEDLGAREIAAGWPGDVAVVRPGLRPEETPRPDWGHDVAAVVVMGSRASVHDDRPWIGALGDWLSPLLDGSRVAPILGICFGHQLIAHRLGARVGFVHRDRRLERGVQETVLTGCRLAPGRDRIHVIVSHGEEVKDVPAGCRVTGRRGAIAVDVFEHETLPVFGVQFHPEAGAGFLRGRDVPPHPAEGSAFEDQALVLSTFRRLAWELAQRDRASSTRTSDRAASRSSSVSG